MFVKHLHFSESQAKKKTQHLENVLLYLQVFFLLPFSSLFFSFSHPREDEKGKEEREVKEKKKKKRKIIKKVVTKRFSLSFAKRRKHNILQNILEKYLGINYLKQ